MFVVISISNRVLYVKRQISLIMNVVENTSEYTVEGVGNGNTTEILHVNYTKRNTNYLNTA